MRLTSTFVATMLAAAPIAAEGWRTITVTDTWGEPLTEAAVSPYTAPIRNLPGGLGGTTARVVVEGCGSVYLEFTETPNLLGGATQGGYDTHHLRGKWDDVPVASFMVDQAWGENVLHFYTDKRKIKRLERHNTLSIALNWYGAQGNAVWKFSLEGAREAIAKARATCRH